MLQAADSPGVLGTVAWPAARQGLTGGCCSLEGGAFRSTASTVKPPATKQSTTAEGGGTEGRVEPQLQLCLVARSRRKALVAGFSASRVELLGWSSAESCAQASGGHKLV